jgi:inosose dehydratase
LPASIRWCSRAALGIPHNHVHCKDVRADVLADVKIAKPASDAVLSGVFTVPGDG